MAYLNKINFLFRSLVDEVCVIVLRWRYGFIPEEGKTVPIWRTYMGPPYCDCVTSISRLPERELQHSRYTQHTTRQRMEHFKSTSIPTYRNPRTYGSVGTATTASTAERVHALR